MLSKIFRRRRNDRADSTIVTFVIVFPLFFSFLITMIDTSVYFANRSIVQQTARDGARTIAIFGGSGDATTQSPLEQAYGTPIACTAAELAKTTNRTAAECSVYRRLNQGAGLTSVVFPDGAVNCGPYRADTVGQTTYCQITWNYNGVPGAVTNFISSGDTRDGTNDALFYNNQTRVTSESEVGMSGINFVNR